MQFLLVALAHHAVFAHGLVREYSDVDQSLLIVFGFLAMLTLGLISAAYLEPGSKGKNSRRAGSPGAARRVRRR